MINSTGVLNAQGPTMAKDQFSFACFCKMVDLTLACFDPCLLSYFESMARPFEWKFTRADLNARIGRMRNRWSQSNHPTMAA